MDVDSTLVVLSLLLRVVAVDGERRVLDRPVILTESGKITQRCRCVIMRAEGRSDWCVCILQVKDPLSPHLRGCKNYRRVATCRTHLLAFLRVDLRPEPKHKPQPDVRMPWSAETVRALPLNW